MSAGRKPIPNSEIVEDTTDQPAVRRGIEAANRLAVTSSAISERFGDGMPYDRSRVVHEARFFQGQAAESMLELGKRLIQIKENEPHGEFIEIVTERLGFGLRSAQSMMQAAVKYLSPALGSNAPTFAHLGRSKLFDLMLEDDEKLLDLAEGGTLAGHTLDEFEAMSAREARAALRDAKKMLGAKQKVIAKRDADIARLEEEVAIRDGGTPEEREALQLNGCRDKALAAEFAIRQLVKHATDVYAAPATVAAETAARQAAEFVAQLFAQLLSDAGLPVNFEEAVTPSWLAAAEKEPVRHAKR